MNALSDREGSRLVGIYLPEIAQVTQSRVDLFAPQRYFANRYTALRIDYIDLHWAFVEWRP